MVNEYRNFLTNEECDQIIKLADHQMQPAKTLGENIDGYRVADNTWLDDEDPLVSSYKSKISELVKIPVENMEKLHIVRYQIGGEYKNHQDFFHPGESYYDEQIKRGGQRVVTTIIYLNDDFEGGETDFPQVGLKVKPETGKLITWKNVLPNGKLDYNTLHAGLPVTLGKKYIATIWIRESKFV
jgi:prolyl 4-hydroxylase